MEGNDKYDYIFVLMLENRSLTTCLVIEEVTPANYFDGVAGKNFSNPLNINPQYTGNKSLKETKQMVLIR